MARLTKSNIDIRQTKINSINISLVMSYTHKDGVIMKD